MGHETNRPLLVTLFFGVLMAALDIAVLGPAIPALRDHFGVDDRTVAWAFNTFVFFNLLGVPIMSKAADVFGRRTVYLVDVSLFAVGAAIVMLAPSFAVLLVGRALQGLAASGIFPVAAAVVGDRFAPEKRGRALGVLGAVFGLAFIVGPILAGILLAVDWRLIYAAFLPLAAVVLVLARRFVEPGEKRADVSLDKPGLVLLGLVLVPLAYGINQVDTGDVIGSLRDPRVWSPLLLAAATLPVFVRRQSRSTDPIIRPGLFRNRQVLLAALLAGCAGLAESAFIFLPAFSVAVFGVSSSEASFMLLPLVVAVAVTSPIAGRILDRTGSKAVILASQGLLTAGFVLVATLGSATSWYYVGSVGIGAGLAGILGPSLSYILLHEARVSERTVSQGLITLFISIGQLVGGAAIGAVAASAAVEVDGYAAGFAAIAFAAALVFVAALSLKGRQAERSAPSGA